jgi:predicted amidohydrolase
MAQIAPKLGDVQHNLDLHLEQIEKARKAEADLIVFPELSLCGYFLRDMVPDVAIDREDPIIKTLISAAGEMSVVGGFVEQSRHHHYYNSAFFTETGKLAHVHRKAYLPTYGLFDEQRYFAAGNQIRAFDTEKFGRVGLLICEDFWHLSALAIMQAEEVDLLICVANSPARGISDGNIQTASTYAKLAETYAALLGAVVLVVNRVGFEDGLCFWGNSRTVGPDGTTMTEGPLLDEALTLVEIDPDSLRRQRLISPLARDERLLLLIEELKRIKRHRYEN